jgi:hypothetical protein
MAPMPHYLDLHQAREVLAEMGVELNARQMKRAADKDSHGRPQTTVLHRSD